MSVAGEVDPTINQCGRRKRLQVERLQSAYENKIYDDGLVPQVSSFVLVARKPGDCMPCII